MTACLTFGFFFLIFSMFVGYMMKMACFYMEADNNGVFAYSTPFG